LLQQSDQLSDGAFAFGEFRLDPAQQQLLHGEAPAPPGRRPFMLLLALVEAAGERLDKETLFSRVWPDRTIENSPCSKAPARRRPRGRRQNA
jgi:DNA-binding winged helix-turn-helix (wHTH) protein